MIKVCLGPTTATAAATSVVIISKTAADQGGQEFDQAKVVDQGEQTDKNF